MSDIQYAVVPAGGADVMTFTTRGIIYLPMRPFCEGLGIDWPNERRRISADAILSKAVVKLTTAFSNGQEQTCLPLTHFHGWLFKLNLNTINERARPIVEALQVEGYQVLHDYWVKGSVTNPRAVAQLEQSERTARRRELPGLMDKLGRERNPEVRRVLHAMIVKACESEGIDPPQLAAIGSDAPRPPEELDRFFALVRQLEDAGHPVNHHRIPGMLAISLVELRELFRKEGIRFYASGQGFKNLLRLSTEPKFIANKSVCSRFTDTAKACWVFAAGT